MNIRALVAVSCTVIASLLAFDTATAVTVSPMQIEMTSSGNKAHSTVTVINNSSDPLPIEAVVKQVSLDENGKSRTTEAGDEFLIMPPQTIIPAGATQNFRIQWLGEPMLPESRSFYVFFNQVPLKPVAGRPNVQIVMSVGTLVNVAPPKGAPALAVVETGVSPPDKLGKRYPTVTVANKSNVHALFSQATVHISGGISRTLPPGLLAERIGSGLVQPGSRRKFTLPVEIPAGTGPLKTTVEFAGRRM